MNETYREIITRAVCGKAEKTLICHEYVNSPQGVVPSQILGCSVTELRLNEPEVKVGSNNDIIVAAGGVLEVHVWYAANNGMDTEVLRCPVKFADALSLEDYDCQTTDAMDIKITVTKSPVVVDSAITKDHRIKLAFEMGLSVEVISETKLLVHCMTLNKSARDIMTHDPKSNDNTINDSNAIGNYDVEDDDE